MKPILQSKLIKGRKRILILSLLFSIIFIPQLVMGNLLGEQHTTTCKNHICTITLEAEPIRFKAGDSFLPGTGGWAEVDEEYHNETPTDCPVEGYDWCAVNKYALNLKDEYDIHIQTKYQQDMFGYKLFGVEYGNFKVYFFPGEATINGSTATYNLTADLKYEIQYLPSRVKDAVLIDRQGFFQNTQFADTFDVWYEVTPGFTYNITNTGTGENASDFNVTQVLKDGEVWYEIGHVNVLNGDKFLIEQAQLEVETFANTTYFVTHINSTKLIEETNYPIYIDPQVDVTVSASYDAYIYKLQMGGSPPMTQYRRFDNPAGLIYVSSRKQGSRYLFSRGVVEYNLSAIPENSTLIDLYFNFSVKTIGSPQNRNITFNVMAKWHEQYPNNLLGNHEFWTDMGNGFTYNIYNLTPGEEGTQLQIDLMEFNATKTAAKIESFFGNVTTFWGLGMAGVEETALAGATLTGIYSRNAIDPGARPMLVVTYREPSENWRYAILLGLMGISGFMMYVSRKMSSEYSAIKLLLMLSSILFGLGAIAVSMVASQSLNQNIEEIIITMFTATTYLLLTVVAFSIMKLLNTTFNILKGRKT